MKVSLSILLAVGISWAASAQLMPYVGYTTEANTHYRTWGVDAARGGEYAGMSASVGSVHHGKPMVLVGAYFCGGKRSILETRAGFVDAAPTLNFSFKFFPRRPYMLAMDLMIKEQPSLGIRAGILLGDIHYRERGR